MLSGIQRCPCGSEFRDCIYHGYFSEFAVGSGYDPDSCGWISLLMCLNKYPYREKAYLLAG